MAKYSQINNAQSTKKTILLLTHFPENVHCDYVQQTKRYLSQHFRVIEIYSPQITQWSDTQSYIKYILDKKNNSNLSKLPVPRILPLRRLPLLNQLDRQMGYLLICFTLLLLEKKSNLRIWTFYPQLTGLISVLYSQKQKLILDLVDIHLKGTTSSSLTYIKQLEWMLKHATTVTAISRSIIHYAQNIYMRKISLVPQGFDLKAMPHIKSKKMYLAGYIGSFNGRVDTQLLLAVIRQLTNHAFLIIGPLENDAHSPQINKNEVFEILTAPNVTWIKALTRTEAMQQLACCYTGIIPYKADLLFNKTAYPMKVLEYFWLGLSVVSTPIPELQRHEGHLLVSNDVDEWVQFLLDSKKRKFSTEEMVARKKIAEDQTWNKKIDMIETIAQI